MEFVNVESASDQAGQSYYTVVVRYTYEGQTYTSESVYPGAEKQIGSEEETREVASQYSPGETATVHVNQEQPRVCTPSKKHSSARSWGSAQ